MSNRKSRCPVMVPNFAPAGQKPPTDLQEVYKSDLYDAFPEAFSGDREDQRSPSICKFLEGMYHGQKVCNLTEDDFKEILLNKCTGVPHRLVKDWINMKISVGEIYNRLYKLYGTEP
eukprot:TRINITY_DN17169_c0_g1_i11.p1 TRINITY_DN17169_c0_g1~~TRINITY_DN17169_c0_g1_i11.p1  ORF type:complete len:117 (-),score=16.10 TRINITY_DN17169_c0_g1_i11:394-744(-)